MTKQIAKQKPTNPLVASLRRDLHESNKKFASLLGVAENDPHFIAWQSEVAHVVSLNQKLLQADRASLLEALRTALTLKLSINPALGEAYLVPRWSTRDRANIVQCQIGAKGLLALVYKTDMIDSAAAFVVYRGEHFVYYGGTDPRIEHTPDVNGDLRTGNFDDIVCSYAVFYLRGSTRPVFKVATRRDLELARRMNLDRDGNPSLPWREHAEAMAEKVAVARATKLLPRHNRLADFHRVVAHEEASEATVEQVAHEQQPEPEEDRWSVTCVHYGRIGVTEDALLTHLGVSDPREVTDEHLAMLEDLYGAASGGDDGARAEIRSMVARAASNGQTEDTEVDDGESPAHESGK